MAKKETYSGPGDYAFSVPSSAVQVNIDCYGGSGGDGNSYGSASYSNDLGGNASRALGKFDAVDVATDLDVRVGGNGDDGTENGASGGYNGGASADLAYVSSNSWAQGGGSGGASDVRPSGGTLDDRYVVGAGGGSGSGAATYDDGTTPTDSSAGADAGYTTGYDAADASGTNTLAVGGGGGTQTSGGSASGTGVESGSKGSGGSGYGYTHSNGHSVSSGSGGSGLYGGGGGDWDVNDGDSAVCAGGGGGSSAVAAAAVDTAFSDGVSTSEYVEIEALDEPSKVTGLSVSHIALTEIDLDWTADEDAEEYDVYRDGSLVATVGSASYTDTGLSESTSYTYEIQATNEVSSGLLSDPIDVTTGGAPTSVSASVTTDNEVDVASDEPHGNYDELRLYRYTSTEAENLIDSTIDAANYSYLDTNVSEGRVYNYPVRAVYRDGESTANEASATTDLPSPTSTSTTVVDNESTSTTWTLQSTDEDGVYVYRDDDDGNGFTQEADLAAGTELFDDSGLLDGQQYQYRVEAYTVDVEEQDTATAVVTDLPDVANVAIDTSAQTEIPVSWDDTTDNGQYRIEYRRDSEDLWTLHGEVATGTIGTDITGLLEGERYRVRVRSQTTYVNGSWAERTGITDFAVLTPTVTESSITVDWSTNITTEDEWVIERREELDNRRDTGWADWETIATLGNGAGSYEDLDLEGNWDYQYRVTVRAGD